MATDFAGKTALITGAGRGIGRAIALGLATTKAALEAHTVNLAAELRDTGITVNVSIAPVGRP